jgi:MGT family glycosyltransferase
MSTYVLGACPIWGHVSPVIAVGQHLRAAGHSVTMLTGSRFREQVEAAGLTHVALPADADFDDRQPDSYMPDRERYRGIARVRYEIETVFVRRTAGQYRGMRALIDQLHPDAVLVDSVYSGALPLLLGPAESRPPIVALGIAPLGQRSVDTAPYGFALPPARSAAVNRLRNRALRALVEKVLFRPTQVLANKILAELGLPASPRFVMDMSAMFDRFFQLSIPAFEYPRSDLAPNTSFVGPLLPKLPQGSALPEWWGDLAAGRPVIHVTQGTLDNQDFGRLIRPAIDGLADLDALVVVSTGGRPVVELGDLPANVRAAEFLPYADLLPRVSAMVTNGGYGGVQLALASGIPLVVAGSTEDKPEVAARVAYTGTGVNLRTGTPSPAAVRGAVEKVLGDPSFAARARELAAQFARHDAFAAVEQELAALGQPKGAAPLVTA